MCNLPNIFISNTPINIPCSIYFFLLLARTQRTCRFEHSTNHEDICTTVLLFMYMVLDNTQCLSLWMGARSRNQPSQIPVVDYVPHVIHRTCTHSSIYFLQLPSPTSRLAVNLLPPNSSRTNPNIWGREGGKEGWGGAMNFLRLLYVLLCSAVCFRSVYLPYIRYSVIHTGTSVRIYVHTHAHNPQTKPIVHMA